MAVDSNKDATGQEIFNGVMVGGAIGMAKVGAKFGGLPLALSYVPTDRMVDSGVKKAGLSGAEAVLSGETAKDALNAAKLGLRNSIKSFYKSPKGVGMKYGTAFLTGGVYGGVIDYLGHHKDADGNHPMWASAAAGGLVGAKVGTLAYGVFGDALMNEAKDAIADGLLSPKVGEMLDKRKAAFNARTDVGDMEKEIYGAASQEIRDMYKMGGDKLKNSSIQDIGKGFTGFLDQMSESVPGLKGSRAEKMIRGATKGYGYAYKRFSKLGPAAVSTGVLAAAGAGIGAIHHKLTGGKVKEDDE